MVKFDGEKTLVDVSHGMKAHMVLEMAYARMASYQAIFTNLNVVLKYAASGRIVR